MKTLPIFIVVLAGHTAFGQPEVPEADPHFPGAGRFHTSALMSYSNSVPSPAVIGDLMYGVTPRTSLGITAGTTGALALYGIRWHQALLSGERVRLISRFVTVYYPERDGRFLFDRTHKRVMPWMLTMGNLDAEVRFRNGVRMNTGIGMMETHCVEDMKMWFNPDHDMHETVEPEESFIDIFTTAQLGVSVPLSRRLTARFESVAVFHKLRLIKKNEFKVTFPINPYVNIIYSF